MRLSKTVIFSIIISAFLFNSCGNCRKCKGDREGLLFVQGKISSIDFMMPGKITIIEDSEELSDQAIIMRGPTAHLEAINRVVDGTGKWSVIYGTCVESGCPDVDILIIVKDFSVIKNLTVSDAGKIFADSSLSTSELTLNVSGSGEIELSKLSVTTLNTSISGSGTINIKGSGTTVNHTQSGNGILEGFNYQAQNYSINHSGSGVAKINATNNLNANLSGSGDVLYVGNPTITSEITGSGQLLDDN